jgi:hypothetical protein
MNANTAFATIVGVVCATMIALMYAPNHKAQEIQACMSQPGMQYVRDFGSHYVCIPITEKE